MSDQRQGVIRSRWPGMAVAGVTAAVSGVSVFVNSYGVRAGLAPAAYTTAKNAVAWVLLVLAGAVGWRWRQRQPHSMAARFVERPEVSSAPGTSQSAWARWLGLAYVGIIGGGLAFVLFFNGLALSEPAPAAFWRDTLVLWVAVIAVLALKERVRWWNVLAIALLVGGEVVVAGGVGTLVTNRAALEILASSVLWGIEVVVARRLLRAFSPGTLARVRMGIGALTLVFYLAVTGSLGELRTMNADQWHWVLITGALLSVYVATWMTALARARALDVTSVLVGSALVTWLLEILAGTATPAASSLGLVLIALGVALVVTAGWRGVRAARSALVTS